MPRKSPGPASAAVPGQKTTGRQPAGRPGRITQSRWDNGALEAMSYPYQSDPIENPVFRPVFGTQMHNRMLSTQAALNSYIDCASSPTTVRLNPLFSCLRMVSYSGLVSWYSSTRIARKRFLRSARAAGCFSRRSRVRVSRLSRSTRLDWRQRRS